MGRKLVLTIILTLVLIGMLGVAFKVQRVKAFGGIVYIRADGSIDPPTAPILSVDNVTYTLTGNIYNSIEVQRNNIVVDGAGYTVEHRAIMGIDLHRTSNVTIKNMEIKAFNYGIRLRDSSYNSIVGNNITENLYYGIELSGSSNNTIYGNNIEANNDYGIYCFVANNNSIYGNNIKNNYYGILLKDSKYNSISANNITNNNLGILIDSTANNNILRDNRMTNNKYNFKVGYDPFFPQYFTNDVDTSNTVNGKPIYFWVNQQDRAVPSDAGYVALVNCNGITVQNLNLVNNWQGILLVFTANSTITKNNITNSGHGIEFYESLNNTISGNSITTNNHYGIKLYLSSNYNTISGNSITANTQNGVYLGWSSNNIVSGNNITNNRIGIMAEVSSNNTISGNNITNNLYGIELSGSSNNIVYHNNFINSVSQVRGSSSANLWDDGYPSGGNYWSDYSGVDVDGDGIGDTPYVINTYNLDRYPLMSMHPVVSPWEEVEPPVADAGPDQSVIQGMTVIFNASGSTDDVGIRSYLWTFTDVTPKTLIDIQPRAQYTFNNVGDFEVTLNVTDYAGKQDTDTMWVHVSADTVPPVANAGPDQTVDEDTLVSFDGSGSTDNVNITSYTWTFIDVTPQTLTGVNQTHTFNTPGEYIITLNVTDTVGNWDTDTVQITVLDLTDPSIGVVLQEPDLPEEGDKITITVDVTDEGIGVNNVTLWYSTNEEATWIDVPMNRTTGDTYVEEIPGLRAGTHVQYKVTAYDKAGNFANTTIHFLTVAKLNTTISISLSSSTSYVGFKVEINGNLICNEVGLSRAPILLSYSVTGGASWNDITLVNTASDGSYSAVWMPSATGNYLVRATWAGNATYWGTNTTINLAVTTYEEQNVFSVTSNSTVLELAFNSTSRELSFTVTGPSGTTGYVNVYIAKTLVDNIADVKVYLDGDQINCTATSLDDTWLLHFTYIHSTHKVTINLGHISATFIETPLGKIVIYGIPITATIILVILYILKKKHTRTLSSTS